MSDNLVAENTARFRNVGKFLYALDAATTPRDGECLTNRWWAVKDGAPLFWSDSGRHFSPQCNANESITRRVIARLYPDCEVAFIPAVFVPGGML